MQTNLFSKSCIEPFDFGIHYGIPDEEYHKIRAVSQSMLKQANNSMKHFLHAYEGKGGETTPALQTGKLLHLAVLQPKVFREKVIVTTATSKASKEYKQLVEDNPDKEIIKQDEADQIVGMVKSILSDNVLRSTITGGKTEVTAFAECPITGLILKGRADFEAEDYLLDYKTCQSAKPSVFERNASSYWYHVQAAHYLDLFKSLGRPKKYYVILAQEKSEPYAGCAYYYDESSIEKGREIKNELLKRVAKAAKENKFTGYSESIVPLTLAHWAMGEEI